jgi:phosphatidylglycerophosphatase A
MSVGLRAAVSRTAFVVATGLGSGYSPIAPGTAGSLVGLLLFWPLARLPAAQVLAATVAVTFLAVLAAHHVGRAVGRKDPGLVVVDEVAGQWVSLLFLPFTLGTAVAAFFLFRLMDVLKPWPARDLEHLPGGVGIVADDIMAGVYANLLLRAALTVWPVA